MARSAVQTKPEKSKNVKRDPVASGERNAAVNRAASHKYFLLEKFEAGLLLRGTEVKSIRSGQVQLKDAYGLVKDGEAFTFATAKPRSNWPSPAGNRNGTNAKLSGAGQPIKKHAKRSRAAVALDGVETQHAASCTGIPTYFEISSGEKRNNEI